MFLKVSENTETFQKQTPSPWRHEMLKTQFRCQAHVGAVDLQHVLCPGFLILLESLLFPLNGATIRSKCVWTEQHLMNLMNPTKPRTDGGGHRDGWGLIGTDGGSSGVIRLCHRFTSKKSRVHQTNVLGSNGALFCLLDDLVTHQSFCKRPAAHRAAALQHHCSFLT